MPTFQASSTTAEERQLMDVLFRVQGSKLNEQRSAPPPAERRASKGSDPADPVWPSAHFAASCAHPPEPL